MVGFSKQRLDLHKSKIGVMSLLGFVDLRHSHEPWWQCDAMESRSKRQASVILDVVCTRESSLLGLDKDKFFLKPRTKFE